MPDLCTSAGGREIGGEECKSGEGKGRDRVVLRRGSRRKVGRGRDAVKYLCGRD
jgi:hypothetical protein